MRNYSYENKWEKLLTPEIVSLLTQIHEFKGKQNLFTMQKTDTLTSLLEMAKIQSTEASNKIEGIFTSNERLKLIAMDKTNPQSRDEEEIAGYRDVLTTIHENYEYISLNSNVTLQLHRDLYKYSGINIGGNYKNTNNIIAQTLQDGTKQVRFTPVEAWEISQAMDELYIAYNEALSKQKANPLLLIAMFVLDFLCIHPFSDGNGRMSRLLTLLFLYRCDYIVGKYISIEKIIEQSKETYYETLEQSSFKWHENQNDYLPFVKYFLGVIVKAYRDFESRVNLINKVDSKPQRVAEIIKQTLGKISKAQILEQCKDISETTVQRALNDLLKNNNIIKIGGGRYTTYIWNQNKEEN